MTPIESPLGGEPTTDAEIQRRAVRGVGLMLGRAFGLRLVTFAGTIALARLLTPSDYGAFAIAIAIQVMGRAVVEHGLGAALVRQPSPPSDHEQRAVTGFALALGLVLATLGVAVGFLILPALGVDDALPKLIAVACLALPVYSLRVVPSSLIERRLDYGRVVMIEIGETLGFYAFAVPGAVAGLGAWSLVGAVPVGAASGVLVANLVQPWVRGIDFDLRSVRPLIAFGLQASAVGPIQTVRDLALVSVVAASGGQALAGFYGLAQRVFSIPIAVNISIARVAFPALSRGEPGAEQARRAGQTVAVTAVAMGLALALTAGAAEPGIAIIFGQRWLPATDIVLTAAAGFLLVGSAGSVLTGLSFAAGHPRVPISAALASTASAVTAAVVLVPPLGATGTGIALGGGLAVFSVLMLWRSPPESRSISVLARALAVAAVAALAGALAGNGESVTDLALALLCSGGVWIALTGLLLRRELALLVRLVRSALRRSGPAPAIEPTEPGPLAGTGSAQGGPSR